MDFIFDCVKKKDGNDDSRISSKKHRCPFFRRNRETLLYNNPNNTNIELSHESINVGIPNVENKNYDACSSAVYAENFEDDKNKKVN